MLRPCLALVGSTLLLSGCSGFGVFLDDTHSATAHVNRPIGNSETMRRVEGKPLLADPLVAERGNVWPGPVPPEPTLEDLQKNPPQPLPDLEGASPPSLSAVPGLTVPVIPHHYQPHPGEDGTDLDGPIGNVPLGGGPPGPLPHTPTVSAPAASPQGNITPTSRGNAISTQAPSGIPQLNPGPSAKGIVVPNGNGTSTVIAPDGSITTIPTPK